jgi:hypothetical protein
MLSPGDKRPGRLLYARGLSVDLGKPGTDEGVERKKRLIPGHDFIMHLFGFPVNREGGREVMLVPGASNRQNAQGIEAEIPPGNDLLRIRIVPLRRVRLEGFTDIFNALALISNCLSLTGLNDKIIVIIKQVRQRRSL